MNRKDGYLFDKEAILQYIITKKKEYARKLKEYERQKHIEENETAASNALEEQKKLLRFINTEKNIITTSSIGSKISEWSRSCRRAKCKINVFHSSHRQRTEHERIGHFKYGEWQRKGIAQLLGTVAVSGSKDFQIGKT